MLVFWILRLVDICTPGTAFSRTVGARVRSYYHIHMHYIIYVYQAFAMGEGYLANRKMVHCLVPILKKIIIVKSYFLCTAWYPY